MNATDNPFALTIVLIFFGILAVLALAGFILSDKE